MPVAVLTEEERKQARKDRRAASARRRYHENLNDSREERRLAKQAQRKRDSQEFPAEAGRNTYDATDYAEEWELLTSLGMRSDQIIARSRPGRDWFVKRVMPLVSRSVCSTCGSVFNPQKVHMLTRCAMSCGNNNKPVR